MELVGLSEIAVRAKVSRQAVINWRLRYRDFPGPVADLKSGPVWRLLDIERWLRAREGKMTKVVSFINLKGGVGKTTNTVAVAEFLTEEHSKRVLVVDLDPQTNITTALISQEVWKERDEQGKTLLQLFKDKLDKTTKFQITDAIIEDVSNLHGGIHGLSLLPSSLGLIEIQDQLALIPAGNFYSISPVEILNTALKPVIDNYDYVLLDCPPNLGIITLNGIAISTGYVVPVIPDILSTFGVPQIENRLKRFAESKGISVPPIGIIISKFDSRSRLHSSRLQELRAKAESGDLPPVFDTIVPQANQIAESVDVAANVNTLRQKYGYGNNYQTFSALTREFIQRC